MTQPSDPNESMTHLNSSSSPFPQASPSPSSCSVDELARIFNSALLATRVDAVRDFSQELYELMESSAFRSILSAIRQLARNHGMSEKEAAESVIQTFRRLDRIWETYLIQDGYDRLKNPGS